MGNVFAASAPSPPPFAAPEPPRPPEFDKPNFENVSPGNIPHPGVMEDLHKKTKDIFPMNFDGVKLMCNKGLSNHFQISHTITLSTVSPAGYRFGATYVGTNQTGPNEAFPILLGDIDPGGNMNANILHQIGERLKFKLACQFSAAKAQNSATQLQADYKGDSYSASVTMANMDIINESGLLVGQYLQSVSKRVALGAELAYQFGPQVPGNEIAILSAAGRYTADNSSFSGTLGPHALHLCFYQKASEQLQLGCELETNLRMGESTATIGYQIDLPKADLVFRGMIDSNWNVGAVLEKTLCPLPFVFKLSCNQNHSTNKFRVGCGLFID